MPPRPKKQTAVRQLDAAFLKIFESMATEVKTVSGTAAAQVLSLSSGFLSEKAQKAVSQFHTLYFGSADVEKSKQEVNVDVDRLFDAIQAEVVSGSDDATIAKNVVENQAVKAQRLSMSGIQKELETLIRLDQGVRDRLMPVLTCMQFEDMVRQRLEHIQRAWEAIAGGFDDEGILDVEMLAMEVDVSLSSNAERKLFYEVVLKKNPPDEDLDSGSVWTDFT